MEPQTDDARYAAIRARDARFDGVFFTCVRTTGIFCRPSCPARTPARGSVEFVPSAAAALGAGFRACKRCGPAAPPGSPADDPTSSLASRALALIEAGALDGEGTVPALAARLAVSERTLHRALLAATGAGALAHARLQRARRAHELVLASDLPLSRVAYAAGFGSERQLHETFTRTYGHAPSALRARTRSRAGAAPSRDAGPEPDAVHLSLRLAVRRPFDGSGLADWFAARAVPGVERVEGTSWTRAVRLPHGPAVLHADLCDLPGAGAPGADRRGVAGGGRVDLDLSLADARDLAAATGLARRLLDLDADPEGIDDGLARAMAPLVPLVAARPGVRIPGAPGLPEALLWAITGQQISAAQARDQIERATDLVAEPLPPALRREGITRLPADPRVAAARAEEWFRGPGARRRTLMTAVPDAPDEAIALPELRTALLALPGIGPWTADYALLRAVRAIDVAPARDAALLGAARDLGIADTHEALLAALDAATPWRSYAVMHLWHHAATLRRAPRARRVPTRSTTRQPRPTTSEETR